ncbi:acyl-CoA dehydrogenase family protein [Paraburkholderia phymatum]|uniref:acyl-CoA dehydrogenase family protein n=1 Tax=Paraburkholderia phymatum TaxID=148447 RepID=UPI0031718611
MISPLPLAAIPPNCEARREQVTAFVREAMRTVPPEIRARSWMGFDPAFSHQLAERGWVGMTLPKAYGGGGESHFARFVVVEELLAAGAPVSAHWIADRQSGPLIAKYGTETQKRFYLPKICNAQAFFCIGMSEPNSGSDLASVGSRAQRRGDGWVLSGRKIWTTNAPHCHYIIALVRTSGSAADRHAGLSQFIVDLSSPGVTVRPIHDLAGDAHFSEIFFDDVLLSDDALVGTEGQGWDQVTAELAFERSGPERIYSSIVLLETWLNYLRGAASREANCIALLGRFTAHLAVLREMSISVTHKLCMGESPVVEAALVKDLGTEFEQSIPTLLADALAAFPDAAEDAALTRTLVYAQQIAPSWSLRGGTREILRGMIARGLGLR